MIKYGANNIFRIKFGELFVDRAYHGEEIIWEALSLDVSAPKNLQAEVTYFKTNTDYALEFTWDEVYGASYILEYNVGGSIGTTFIEEGVLSYSMEGARRTIASPVRAQIKAKKGILESIQSEIAEASIRGKAIKPGKPTNLTTSGGCKGCVGCDCTSSASYADYAKGKATKSSGADYVTISTLAEGTVGGNTTASITVKYVCAVVGFTYFSAIAYNDGTASDEVVFSHRQKCLEVKPI